jgi:peptide/nickel transport system substrate-binding protein
VLEEATVRRSFTLLMSLAFIATACQPAAPSSSAGPPGTQAVGTTVPGTPAAVATPPTISRDKKTLVIAVDAFGSDFDPASSYLLAQGLIWRGTYDPLVRLKGGSADQIEAALAETWEANTDSSVWTFHLRKNVKFTDGTPFDAAAVKANYVRTIKLELGTQLILGAFITDPEKQIVVVDPSTVRFDLGSSVPHFGLVLAAEWGTGIASPKVFTDQSKGPEDQGHEYLLAHAVGTGPYIVTSIAPDDQVVLDKNPDYWGGWSGDHFDKVIIRSVPNGATRRQLIESGDVDISIASTSEDTAAIKADPRFFIPGQTNLAMDHIVLGDYGLLDKPEARQAMTYLFPYDDYIATVAKGDLARPNSVLPDLLLTSVKDYAPKTDLEKAKTLFQTAGIPQGTKFTYEYYTGFGKEAGEVMQAQLEQVGMKLEIIEKSFSAFNGDLTSDRPVDQRANMYFWGWWPDYNHPSNYSWILFDSAAAPDACPCYNSGYYKNADVDKIIDDGFGQADPAKLAASFKEAQRIMGQDVDPPIIAVGQPIDTTYYRTDILGQVSNPLYIFTWDFWALHRG